MNNAPYGEKKILPATLVIASLVILFWAMLRAFAAWHFIAAQSIAEPLLQTGRGSEAVFAESEAQLDIALERFPGNPDFLDLAGQLSVLQASQTGVVGAARRALLESAAEDFRRALAVRPLWPYSWANLLAVKDKLGQVDMEFNVALNRAVELGPWEPGVQLQVVESGLRYWDRLGSIERALVQRKVLDALKVQPREVFATIKDYGRPDLVCAEQDMHVQIRQWCAEVGAQG